VPKVKHEISYKALQSYLKNLEEKQLSGGFAPVYLIFGEELLYKTALEELLKVLMPAAKRSLNYEPIEGTGNNIQTAIERINTYSLMPGTKVVAICDSDIFYSKQDEGKLIIKAKEAYTNNDHKNAAKYFLNILGLLNLSFDDLRRENRTKALKLDTESLSDDRWLDDIIDYCLDNSLPIPAADDNAEVVGKAILKGFPRGNHLIITTDLVDKRRSLYKIIRKEGVIIDCAVPKGDRRADKMAQENTLSERRDVILKRFDKTIDQDAYRAVCEMTGFDLRTFTQNLEKLASYVGDRTEISVDDVGSVLERTKKDPVYELTNAVSDRNVERVLFYLKSLLANELHPLQILAAITNQIRKLLLVKGFAESSQISSRHAGAGYGYFKNHIMPLIQAHDRELLDQIESWESMISKDTHTTSKSGTKKGAKKKSKLVTDLMIAKNPNNPYPVYILLQKSEKYTIAELIDAFECLSRADMRLKSTGQRPKLILEEAILKICRQR
jgi:DNA polymerase-3 subunit delta